MCDVQKLMACSHGPGGAWSELEAECGPEDNRDVRCTCANACVIEYIECIDVSTATVCPTSGRLKSDVGPLLRTEPGL